MAERAPLKPIYLICGSDLPKVRRTVTRLRKAVFDETASDLNIVQFDARLNTVDEVLEAANTPTFTLGTRLVLVAGADTWKAADRERIAVYLGDPMPDVCIALVGDSFKETERLAKLVKKGEQQLLRFDLPKHRELEDWVRDRAHAHHARLAPADARYLVGQVGDDAQLLENEIAKLAVYARQGAITREVIDEVCVPTVEAKVYELTDVVGRRDREGAFRVLETLFATAGRSADETARSTLFSLLKFVDQLRATLELPPDMPSSEVAKTLGVHPFTARKLCEQRERFDRRMLERALIALADAQAAMVGKSELDAAFVLEIALGRLLEGAAARRAG